MLVEGDQEEDYGTDDKVATTRTDKDSTRTRNVLFSLSGLPAH